MARNSSQQLIGSKVIGHPSAKPYMRAPTNVWPIGSARYSEHICNRAHLPPESSRWGWVLCLLIQTIAVMRILKKVKMRFSKAVLVFLFFSITLPTLGATRTAIASGNWALPSTWDCGCVPDNDDNVIIPSGRTVYVTFPGISMTGATAITITVRGELVLSSAALTLNGSDIISIPAGGRVSATGLLGGVVYSGFSAINDFPVNGPASITNGTLPITLNYFVAEKSDDDVLIRWEVALEENVSHYEIERSSNGKDFEVIRTLSASPEQVTRKTYQFTDGNPIIGRSYYRLRTIDVDGTTEIFEVVSVFIEHLASRIDMYPNPLESPTLTIQPNTAFKEGDYFVISTSLGKPIFKQSLNGFRNVVDLSALETGVYYIDCRTHFGNFRERLLKK